MKYVVRPAARRDLQRHWSRLAEDSGQLVADRFINAADAEFLRIASHPAMLGHEIGFRRHVGVRSRVVPGYPYLIFYVIHTRYVEFKRVLHGARNLQKFFRRL